MNLSSFYTCEVKGRSLKFELYSHNKFFLKKKKEEERKREKGWEEGEGKRKEGGGGEYGGRGTEEDEYESNSMDYLVETKLKLNNYFFKSPWSYHCLNII